MLQANCTLLDKIKNTMINSKATLAVAESVTAGLVQASFTQVKDASMFFHGGITAYNLGQKARHLNINSIHAESCDSVSRQTAEEMAFGVAELFGSCYGIAITGYASKVPEKGVDQLYAFAACVRDSKLIFSSRINARKTEEGLETQMHFVNEVLKKLSRHLASKK